jgi:hypothetical protein
MPDKLENAPMPPERVDARYSHTAKRVMPRPVLAVAGRQLKWYDIAAPEAGVPDAIHLMARDYLERHGREGNLGQLGELGFVILHRCGEAFYFLIACSWRGNNEIWESVYAKDAEDPDFRDFPRPGPHVPTYCVWEMGAVAHESQAWSRFLRSRRDHAAVAAWLEDRYEGAV